MANVLAAYMQGQQAVENNKRNKLLELQLQNAPAEQERSNRLADLQLQRSQQQIDVTNSEQQKAQELEALKRGIAGAQYVAQSKSPKAEAEQRYPDFVQQFQAKGGDWASLDDQGVRDIAAGFIEQMSAKAGIGPTPKLQTTTGADGQVLQTDPTTGKVTQAVAPREDFRAKSEYADNLARRRDAEQRDFQRQQAKERAAVDKELAAIRATSAGEKPTDSQRLSAGFLLRMQDTEPSFGARDPTGSFVPSYVPTTKDYVLFNKILKNEGGFFGSGTAAELNKQLPPDAQQYFQQAQDWVRAKLRKESGAAIGAQEMLNEVSTYFPLPGDGQKTLDAKARSRQVAIEAMKIAAGAPGDNAKAPPRQSQPSAPKQIASEAEYNALPSGAQYIGPDGKLRQKR